MKLSIFIASLCILLIGCTSAGGVTPIFTLAPPLNTKSVEPNQPTTMATTNAAATPANPYAPRITDQILSQSSIYLKTAELLVMESYPPQFLLSLTGDLPTPCHEIRAVIHEPDDDNNIETEVYSLTDPNTVCVQVLEPFEVKIPINISSPGRYSVSVNGQKIGEFDW